MATKVKLRKKKISGNRQSLYLDFYPAIPHPETGEPTRREFLGLYLFDNLKNPIDKQHNKETSQLAEQIRQKRENHLNKPEIYTGYEKEQLKIKEQGEQNFVQYFKSLADKRKASNHDPVGIAKPGYGDSGSAARFFYACKADSDERLGSKHPTVKPLELMKYLCKLITPPDGLILDPFLGSGSTAVAAYLQNFRCIGIEQSEEYVKDAIRRVEAARDRFALFEE